ncbi:hypothetical protein ACWGJ2_26425 [Streptomyces sp. NPDC054796]
MRHLSTPAGLVAAAVLLATAGCAASDTGGGGGDGDGHRQGARGTSSTVPGATATASPSAPDKGKGADGTSDGASGGHKANGAQDAAKGPKVPRSELTPATGSFTGTEKDYLENRVPKGVDPAAILDSGRETCQRVSRTVEADRAAAVKALRDGEIPGAKAAIGHLCPQHKDVLKAAGK